MQIFGGYREGVPLGYSGEMPLPPPCLDRDTFLIAVYCVVDDLVGSRGAAQHARRRGPRPRLSESEVLTLALLAQWWPDNSEQGFWTYAKAHLRPYFPHLLERSALNRRIRGLAPVLASLGPRVAARASQELGLPLPPYEVVDGAPVPLMRRTRGQRQRVFTTEASFGRGGADKAWYYGLKDLLVVDAWGFVTGFVLGPAHTDERLLFETLLRWRADPQAPLPTADELAALLGPTHHRGGRRLGPSGPLGPRQGVGTPQAAPTLGDQGFRGTAWQAHWQHAFATALLTAQTWPDAPAPPTATGARSRAFHAARQVVERTIGRLEAVFHLAFPLARTLDGLWARLSAKVAAHNLLLYLNRAFGRPPEAHFNPLFA